MTFSVYVLFDPIVGIIRYVGCTKQTLAKRLANHIYQKTNDHRGRWINSLLLGNRKPTIELLEECRTEEEMLEAEMFYIAYFKVLGFPLVNSSPGGIVNPGANRGRKWSADTRRKMSLAHKGKKLSDEHKAKLSVARQGHPGAWLGKKRSNATKAKISASNRLAWQRKKLELENNVSTEVF